MQCMHAFLHGRHGGLPRNRVMLQSHGILSGLLTEFSPSLNFTHVSVRLCALGTSRSITRSRMRIDIACRPVVIVDTRRRLLGAQRQIVHCGVAVRCFGHGDHCKRVVSVVKVGLWGYLWWRALPSPDLLVALGHHIPISHIKDICSRMRKSESQSAPKRLSRKIHPAWEKA